MLVVVGDLVEDIVVWLAEPLRHATDSAVEIFRTRGGSAANVAAFAGPIYPTRFVGCVGTDGTGRLLAAELTALGVDVRVQYAGTTGAIVILVEPDGERTMLPQRGAARLLADVPEEWLNGVSLLHVPAYGFDGGPLATTARDLVDRTRARGGLVSIDASSVGVIEGYGIASFVDLLADIAPDLLFANEAEALALGLTGGSPTMARLASTIVVVKHGSEPTVVYAPGSDHLVVAVPPVTDVRDLTGAGDAFAAGFLTAYLADPDVAEACARGHALAAAVLASPGANRITEGPVPNPTSL